MRPIHTLFATMFALLVAGSLLAGSDDKQAFLKVSPLAGETKTNKSGSGRGLIGNGSALRPQNTSKTVTRNMKWNCEVRYRGRGLPQEVELRVFYIGYEDRDVKPKILGKDVKKLTLDANGKASVELASPTVKFSKSRTSSSSGSRTHAGHIAKTKTTVTGERMAGCVVQLWEAGALVRSYASMSTWDHAAKAEDFSDEVLNRKEKNRLN